MKALTIWQPWASLVAWGAKRFETRSWPAPRTLKPGDLLAIHAAKRPVRTEEWDDALWREVFAAAGGSVVPRSIPVGKVLAICQFLGCEQITADSPERTPTEEAICDWTPGRFAWRLKPVHILDELVPATGRQGLWEWEPSARVVRLLKGWRSSCRRACRGRTSRSARCRGRCCR